MEKHKLKRRRDTKHSEHKNKSASFFEQQTRQFAEQQHQLEQLMVARSNQPLVVSSLKIAHVLMSQRKPFTLTESAVKPCLDRVTIFSLCKRKTGSLRVITSAHVCPFFCPKTRENQKKVIISANVHFSAQKQVMTKKINKRSSRSEAVVCSEIFQNVSWKNDLTCFHCS